MNLSHKERVRRALRHQPVDRLPTQVNCTSRMASMLASHFNIAASELPVFLDNHLLRVDITHTPSLSPDGLSRFDWWGAGHDVAEEGYYIRINPLATSKYLDAYPWPDPDAPGLLDDAKRTIAMYGGEYFIVPNLGFALFERAWSLRGFEHIFLDIGEDPAFVEALLDRITAIQLRVIQRFLEIGVDGGYFGDDYGAQKSMLISPASWRRLMKPRLARMFAPFRERGLPVLMHSDGQIQKVLPDLLDIGLTTLNPVQPEVLDHDWLHASFGGRLSFYGGISTQTVLPSGTPAEVKEAVAQCIRSLAPDGTGLMIAPSHRMMSDIPIANIEALLAAFAAQANGNAAAQTRPGRRAAPHGAATETDAARRKAAVTRKFIEIFKEAPAIWARAPGRVDLMGSHTDYNQGHVMTMTIDRDTWIAALPRQDRQVRVHSMNLDGDGEFCLDSIDHDASSPWTDYIRGMAHTLMAEGYALGGVNLLVHSTIPLSSGLSSSAAIEMACGVVFQAVGGFRLDPVRMALLGQRAENRFVGVNCGILDQYSSALGQAGSALLLDCRDLTSQAVPIAAGIEVVLCDTRAKRNLLGSEYGERRAQCEQGAAILRQFDPRIRALRDVSIEQLIQHRDSLTAVTAKRCRFIIEEDKRVVDLADALSQGDRVNLRELFAASYLGARDLYEIGAPAMEAMMEAMLAAPGVIAARQAGAGFGGCMVALVESGAVEMFKIAAGESYRSASGIAPVIYPVGAAAGAGLLHD
jgi:galactokinase